VSSHACLEAFCNVPAPTTASALSHLNHLETEPHLPAQAEGEPSGAEEAPTAEEMEKVRFCSALVFVWLLHQVQSRACLNNLSSARAEGLSLTWT